MAITANLFLLSATLILILTFSSLHFTAAQIGVCYGRNGRVPDPARTVALFKQYNIQRMRIYDPDPATLQALRGSGIELTVGILNMKLRESAATQDLANAWVQNNVVSYGDVRFRNVVVGNEVFPINPDTQKYADLVLPAMRNIRAALNAANLGHIKVTTAVGTEVIDPATNYPSSRGDFRPELKPYLDPIVRFLVETGSPLFAIIYPYFAYVRDKQIPFDYAFLQPGAGFVDRDGVRYENLYYALADVVNAALEKSTARITSLEQTGQPAPPPELGGGESGVPTEGETDATSSIENARIYNNNLVQVVKRGTPRRPGKPIETYIFAMFDENEKDGAEIEKHFGIFNDGGQNKMVRTPTIDEHAKGLVSKSTDEV